MQFPTQQFCQLEELTCRVGWMLSTHSPPQKCRKNVCFTAWSTTGAAMDRDTVSSVSALRTSGLIVHALNTARDCSSCAVLFACAARQLEACAEAYRGSRATCEGSELVKDERLGTAVPGKLVWGRQTGGPGRQGALKAARSSSQLPPDAWGRCPVFAPVKRMSRLLAVLGPPACLN